MRNRAARLIATWFGLGYCPGAPGTAGSLAALALALVLEKCAGWGPFEFALLAACCLIPGVWAAHIVAASTGGKDPSIVVVDEVVGQWVALAGASVLNWQNWLAAFLLFRLFDIWKPPPARQLERLPGGAGIVADDVMAGIYAAAVLYGAGRFHVW